MDALKLLRITQSLMLLHAVALSALVYFGLITIWSLAGFTVFYGVVSATQLPANQTIIPSLMPRRDLASAYGFNSLTFNLSRFGGPLLAGYIIGSWGTAPAIFCNALSAATLSLCLAVLHAEFAVVRKPRAASSHMFGEIRDGFSYAVAHKGIGPAIVILAMLSLLTLSVGLLLPSLADGVYHAGANGLAGMAAIYGVGAIVSALYLTNRRDVSGLTVVIARAISVLGCAFVGLAFSGFFWLALMCVFASDFASMTILTGSMTLMQYSVDVEMRGRVASFYGLITHGGPGLGALAIGILGDRFGIPFALGIAGALTVAIGIWAAYRRAAMASALESPTSASNLS